MRTPGSTYRRTGRLFLRRPRRPPDMAPTFDGDGSQIGEGRSRPGTRGRFTHYAQKYEDGPIDVSPSQPFGLRLSTFTVFGPFCPVKSSGIAVKTVRANEEARPRSAEPDRSAGSRRGGQQMGPFPFGHAAPDAVRLLYSQGMRPALGNDRTGRADCLGAGLPPSPGRPPLAFWVEEESAGQAPARSGPLPVPQVGVRPRKPPYVRHDASHLCRPGSGRGLRGGEAPAGFAGPEVRGAVRCRVLVDHDVLVIMTIGLSTAPIKTLTSPGSYAVCSNPDRLRLQIGAGSSDHTLQRPVITPGVPAVPNGACLRGTEHRGVVTGGSDACRSSRFGIALARMLYAEQSNGYDPSGLRRPEIASGSSGHRCRSVGGIWEGFQPPGASYLQREVSEVSL